MSSWTLSGDLGSETITNANTVTLTGGTTGPDGERITFASDREGTTSIYWQNADGSGVAERLDAHVVDLPAIRAGAYLNDGDNNPHRIIATAPDADWRAPHGRAALGAARVALRSGALLDIEPATLSAVRGG